MDVIQHAQLGSFWKLFHFKILHTNHGKINFKSFLMDIIMYNIHIY